MKRHWSALMMLSMAFVTISMSAASAKRIVEVLDETTDLPPAKQPVQQVKDGGIEFEHVTFKYKHGSAQTRPRATTSACSGKSRSCSRW